MLSLNESFLCNMISQIASEEVQKFIAENERADERVIILRQKTILGIPSSVIADQISGRRKAKEKLPLFYRTTGIVYPPKVNLEQCSSEVAAKYKAGIVTGVLPAHKRLRCADLTGGFGVDSFYLGSIAEALHYVEPNSDLLAIAKHNHSMLGATNISYHTDSAESFLNRTKEKFDLVYIDPSRRSSSSQKIIKLSDCQPDISALIRTIFSKTNYLLIKASPLLDLQQGLKELPGTESVYIVSVDNECKEQLFLCTAQEVSDPIIHAVQIQSDRTIEFSFTRTQEKNCISTYSEVYDYLYEPNASILKSGAFKLIGSYYGLNKVHANTHLYTSMKQVPDFPGRIFKIVALVKPSSKNIKAYFEKNKANVITRNFPMSADELRKKVGLQDGGDRYLIAFTSLNGKQAVVAERMQ